MKRIRKNVFVMVGVLALIAISITTWTAIVRYQNKRVATTAQSFDLVALAKNTRAAVVLIQVFDSAKDEVATGSETALGSSVLEGSHQAIKADERPEKKKSQIANQSR